jgi:hypothetical protein
MGLSTVLMIQSLRKILRDSAQDDRLGIRVSLDPVYGLADSIAS